MDGFTILAVFGGVLIVAAIFTRKIWQITVGLFYKNPDAVEPSTAGYAARAMTMIIGGVIFLVLGISNSTVDGDESEGRAELCSEVTDAVGHPSSLEDARDAINRATSSEQYSVESETTTDDQYVSFPDDEVKVTTKETEWIVSSGGQPVAKFTWDDVESDTAYSDEGFRALPCDRLESLD